MNNEQRIDVMWDDTPVDVSTEVNFIQTIYQMLCGRVRLRDILIQEVSGNHGEKQMPGKNNNN